MIITDRIETFREAACHIWNVYFCVRAQQCHDWDLRDAYSEVYVALFKAIVCFGLAGEPPCIPHLWEAETTVLMPYRLVGGSEPVDAMISRDIPASGYWDHPTNRIALKGADLRLISLFDWDQLGFAELSYFRARILQADDPELVGRDALIDVGACGLDYQAPQQDAGADAKPRGSA